MGMTRRWLAQNLLIQTNIKLSMSRSCDRWQEEQILNQSTSHHIFIRIILFNFRVQVGSGELLKFQTHYRPLLKASMTTLRKRDKKQEKLRSEEAAKRKKMTEPIILHGPKRGKGRRTHQRKVKALLKQEESQKKFREREEAMKKSEATYV